MAAPAAASWARSGTPGETAFAVDFWAECLRVLKPGGHVVAFSGTRTVHRMVCAIEDAGFEIRDSLQWLYGSGFPKSHDVAKGLGKQLAGPALREEWEGWGTALKPAVEPICLARKPLVGTVAAERARARHRGD
jgi:site-specific DNA-methyltransferase (adenine-specific)